MNFKDFELIPELIHKCESLGYLKPTPIQQQAIPSVLEGSDLIGCAETGSGKSAAFLLPLIQRLRTKASLQGIRALVVAPTRELALQIEGMYRQLALKDSPKCVVVIGGARDRKSTRLNSSHANI